MSDVTITVTKEEADMLVLLAENTVKDYEIRSFASGRHAGLIAASKEIIKKVKAQVPSDEQLS